RQGDRQADRRPDRRADGPQGRPLRRRGAGPPGRHRRPGRQLGAGRLRPQPPRTTSQASGTRLRTYMQIKPDEITSILKSRIEGLEAGQADLTEVGTVLSVADGIARVHGLENCQAFEMLELPHDVTGLALNLESDNVGTVLFGPWDKIVEGDTVKRTNRLL